MRKFCDIKEIYNSLASPTLSFSKLVGGEEGNGLTTFADDIAGLSANGERACAQNLSGDFLKYKFVAL